MFFSITSNDQVNEHLMLYDGVRVHSVDPVFYEAIRQKILEVCPALIRDVDYTAKMLCGPEFWSQLSDNQQRLAGRCVAHMARNGLLPLRRLGCRHKSPARYAPQ